MTLRSFLRGECPYCLCSQVSRSHRRDVKDRLLSGVRVYPYRCRVCSFRFYVVGKQGDPPSDDRGIVRAGGAHEGFQP
jgi:hypothetical protein